MVFRVMVFLVVLLQLLYSYGLTRTYSELGHQYIL